MRKWPDWFTYGRPFFHYWGAAIMLVLSIVGVCLSVWQIWKTGLPWWGWMLVAFGVVALLIYAHMRQWREWNRELSNFKRRLGGTVRLASQVEIDSPHEDAPYGRKVVFQTVKRLEKIRFEVQCTAPVNGKRISSHYFNAPGAYHVITRKGVAKIALVDVQGVPFLPETPLIVELYGPRPFEVVGVV